MQRILFALVAIMSLLVVNIRPSAAQDEGKAVEPTPAPQAIDERLDGKHGAPPPAAPAG